LKQVSGIFGLLVLSAALVATGGRAQAQQTESTTAPTATPTPAATPSPTAAAAPTPQGASGDLDEIVVNGIRRGDLIMPTTVTSGAAYGLDLGVMDTPRSSTVISQAQLAALNIQNPGGFSYLTSSSYSDASFGQPNVPRIRGQYGDMFFNGMRESFTLNGYGAPISFNSVDSIDIVKGPASVQAGPGAGVGGAIDITTKMPSLTKSALEFSLEGDSQQKRIAAVDFGGPVAENTAARVSLTSNDSGSYYYDMFFHQQAAYVALLSQLAPDYTVRATVDFADTQYRENDGVNRVNQALIDNGTYLTGAPAAADIEGFGTVFTLPGTTAQLNPRTIIDEPPGTGAHAQHLRVELIQDWKESDSFSISNNTLYDYLNRYNQIMAYYADTAKNSFTIENKTDFKAKFSTGSVDHGIDAGFTYRYAHVYDVQNFINEPVGIYDLTGNPNSWTFPSALQLPPNAFYPAYPYYAAFNHLQYGASGRTPGFVNGTADSNLQDGAIFLEHRIKFSPQLSLLYGLRADVLQLDFSDPFGGAVLYGLPKSVKTGWYGLRNGNLSLVYSPTSHVSAYLTYNNAQYALPTANDGAIATWGEKPSEQLKQDTLLYEAGLKFDLLDKALFISTAVFAQTKAVPIGIGVANSVAHIKGAEIELNFQPDPHFFGTASYSYLHTTLDYPGLFPFYNFPAYAGTFVDGAGTAAVFKPNQSFEDPGVPKHLFNVLANYKHESGFGVQGNIQVTGPFYVSQPGYLDINATNANAAADFLPQLLGPGGVIPTSVVSANGYFTPPRIPWQFTLNSAVFYTYTHYTLKFSVYNLTSQHNLVNDVPFYGNDFLTRVPPRSYDISFIARF
jgi:outer membrane receptor protein involved in Fe transport